MLSRKKWHQQQRKNHDVWLDYFAVSLSSRLFDFFPLFTSCFLRFSWKFEHQDRKRDYTICCSCCCYLIPVSWWLIAETLFQLKKNKLNSQNWIFRIFIVLISEGKKRIKWTKVKERMKKKQQRNNSCSIICRKTQFQHSFCANMFESSFKAECMTKAQQRERERLCNEAVRHHFHHFIVA